MDLGNILVGVTLTIAVLSLLVVVYVLFYMRKHRGVFGIALLFGSEFIYALSYALMLSADTLEAKMLFVHLEYTVIPFIAVTLLYVARKIIHREQDDRIIYYLPFLIVPILTFVVVQFTYYTPIDWYYRSYDLDYVSSFGLYVLVAEKGWLYYVNTFHNVGLIAYTAFLFFKTALRSSGVRRKQNIALGSFSVLGLIVAGMILLGETTFPIDITLYLTAMLGVLFLVALFHYEIFFLVPRAYRVTYRESSDPILVLDDQLRIIEWNKAAENSPLFDNGQLTKYVSIEDTFDFDGLTEAIQHGTKDTFRYHERHFVLEPFFISNRSHWFSGYVVKIDDMTSYIKRIERLDYEASHDTLTKALNRRALFKRVKQIFSNPDYKGKPYALMMLDIDDFKRINDKHGHIVGDMLLEDFTYFIKSNLPDDSIVSRYGGEEFVVLLIEESREEAMTIAENLRERIADKVFVYDGHEMNIRVSIGVASGTIDSAVDLLDEIDAADKAMYASKDDGKNKVTARGDV